MQISASHVGQKFLIKAENQKCQQLTPGSNPKTVKQNLPPNTVLQAMFM